jgi:[ribosomal protein S5]-alanine N-acetyltransferase
MAINQSAFDNFPILKSKRLTLRRITEKDIESIYNMRVNDRINAFIARQAMDHVDGAKALVKKVSDAYENKTGIGWAGELRDDQTSIGTCGFNRIDYDNNRAELGGELSVEFWGKHIAAEAVEAIVSFGLMEMNLHAIEAYMSPSNRGAIYLLEKLGFKKEAHFKEKVFFKNEYLDIVVYTLLKSDFTPLS